MNTPRVALSMLAIASLAVMGGVSADEVITQGYLTDSANSLVRNGAGGCWHTGSWTAAMAIEQCDPDLIKVAEVAAPVIPEKAAPIVVTLAADALFDFDTSTLRPAGRKQLDDEVVAKMKEYPQIEKILVTGHADRIGSAAYNQKLSQRRADAVKDYLTEQGVAAERIQTAAKGESEPVVSCADVKGKESGKNRELVTCLQPNRRIVVEILLQQAVDK